ncbi:aldehyde dehydrogenase family protein [Acidocella aminolytica]|jgi:aldehyde dehydrogenase (NAD+)|uniref:Aldehyde dehydrogenase n=1 Tax=Acidocella aminolytica 101 = DSM 11237 TaxID=1120923 RepID=A0A0D6PHL9_9PROT|nr:aldehyde dehydrogenase family protein [Acidocella aminolytica]GAN80876.1 aldehyde dehydrogenase [Acidocella aminolytica 101 = DSM 11237]SHE31115.1 aldehyde dehydrogenase (NAD+) [Acidocella aminolytica 101 = DSM 11237]
MSHNLQFYIDGAWVDPITPRTLDVINPATETAFAQISIGSAADVDLAVAAARRAFESFSQTSREERLALLRRIQDVYMKRYDDVAEAIRLELGAPVTLARESQAAIGAGHIGQIIKVLEDFEFDHMQGTTLITREAMGVVGMITPWNWPMNQITCKVCPALAAGCTMVLKPSEIAPMDAIVFAEIMHEAGVPKGVFNLVQGLGAEVGAAISSHPDIDMISFTGSTRAGALISKAAADTVKKVHLELGGKSPNIILDDADISKSVASGIVDVMQNTGQSCNAPTRMFVPRQFRDVALSTAKEAAEATTVGDPASPDIYMGPVISDLQFNKIQDLIQAGIDEGALLVTGGVGRPAGLNKGYYVRPTVFADVTPEMRIAREEIFGPVLSILFYDSEEEVVRLANDTVYGLAAYIQSGNQARAQKLSRRLRAGNVYINNPKLDLNAPFGGYKQSGNGREWGVWGLEEFLEIKGVVGFEA